MAGEKKQKRECDSDSGHRFGQDADRRQHIRLIISCTSHLQYQYFRPILEGQMIHYFGKTDISQVVR